MPGTSRGAKKGWITRKGGGSGGSSKSSSKPKRGRMPAEFMAKNSKSGRSTSSSSKSDDRLRTLSGRSAGANSPTRHIRVRGAGAKHQPFGAHARFGTSNSSMYIRPGKR